MKTTSTVDGEKALVFTDDEICVIRGALIAHISIAMEHHEYAKRAGRTELASQWLAEVRTAETLTIRL